MSTALNFVKLAGVLVGSLIYVVGLGWLIVGPLLNGSLLNRKRELPLISELPLILLAGFVVNYGLILVLQSLKITLIVGAILALSGIITFGTYIYRYHFKKLGRPDTMNKWIAVGFFCLLILSPILTLPLEAWDARSIWFFHAKMIYSAGTIGSAAGWQEASVAFSQVDYPKLFSSMAAQVMYTVGFWNEYLPKIVIFLIFIPAVTWLITLARRSFGFLFLIILIPFTFFPWLWNGYLDGLLALYFCLALLLFNRYFEKMESVDLFSALACTLFLLYLKNEGILAVLSLIFAIVVFYFIKKRPILRNTKIKPSWRYVTIGLVSLIPFFLWWIYKYRWGLSSDLGLGTSNSFQLLSTRLSDGSLRFIVETLFQYIEVSMLLLSVMLVSILVFRLPFVTSSVPPIIASLVYVLGMVVVYLITPHDLVWHLRNSAVRVMELANGGFIIASYLILDALEHDPVVLEPKPIRHI